MEIICVKSKFMKGLMNQNTYIVKNAHSAIIIDAGAEVEDVLKEVEGVKVLAILMTHLHFDHFWNIEKYLNIFDCKVYICENAEEKFIDYNKNGAVLVRKDVVCHVKSDKIAFFEDELSFDGIEVNVYFTPGHCSDCVCLKIGNVLFSGDTLFENGIGRTDLFDSSEEDMINTLKLLKTIDFDIYYPGHYGSATKDNADKIIDYYI